MKITKRRFMGTISIVFFIIVIVSFFTVREINALKATVTDLESILNETRGEVSKSNQEIEFLESLKTQYESIMSKNKDYIKDLESRLEKFAGQPINSKKKTAYFTFDDGPSANTNKILNILDSHNIKATFFVVGRTGEQNIAIYNRIIEDGHTLGNHTYSHVYKNIYKDTDAFMADIYKLEDHIFESTGHKTNLVRFPGGSSNSYIKNNAQDFTRKLLSEGYQYFDWNVDSGDALPSPLTSFEIVNHTVNSTKYHHDAIILMHEKNTTVAALPTIINYLTDLGYTFDTLSMDSFYVHHR